MFYGKQRTVEVGLLHGTDDRLATLMLARSDAQGPFECRLNKPYSPNDGVLHTIEKQLCDSDTPSIMIEIRNDLLIAPQQISAMTKYLNDVILHSIEKLNINSMNTPSEYTQ